MSLLNHLYNYRLVGYFEEMTEKLAKEQNLSEPLTITTDTVTLRFNLYVVHSYMYMYHTLLHIVTHFRLLLGMYAYVTRV